jgi:FdrA protein
LKGDPEEARNHKLPFAAGLEEAAELAISVMEGRSFAPTPFSDRDERIKSLVQEEKKKPGRGKYLRGLFSGGTLAEEALLILSNQVGDIHSNIPLKEELKLKDSWKSAAHTIVDLGEDEFTRGRPHPMIDYSLRIDRLLKESDDRDCGVILLDVVLGHGSHEDPAAALVPVIKKAQKMATAQGRHVSYVASITGTNEDPQNYEKQKRALEQAGVLILPSNAQAARFSALLLKRVE